MRITKKCTGAAKSGRFQVENHLSPPGDFGRYATEVFICYTSAMLRFPDSTASPSTSTTATTIRRISTRSTVIPKRSSKFAPVLYWRVGYHAELRSLLPNGASFTAKPCLQTGLWPKHSNRCCQSNRWTDDHDPSHSQCKTCWTNFAICTV